MSDLRANDLVTFAGPSRPVMGWPAPGEPGVIQEMRNGSPRVVWEQSRLIIAWPTEWVRLQPEPEVAAG